MALTTFTPPIAPAPGSSRPMKPRTNIAPFGDGYEQRSDDGLNTLREGWTLQWPILTVAQADDIETFFKARGSKEAFWWTAPRDSTAKKWRIVDWNRTPGNGDTDSIAATITQAFDLGS